MEYKEILRRVKYIRDRYYLYGEDSIGDRYYFYGEETVTKDCEALDKAISAVKKTIPQKVKRDPFGVECPNCEGRIVLPSTYTFDGKKIGIRCDYCYSCGQALDWSEE